MDKKNAIQLLKHLLLKNIPWMTIDHPHGEQANTITWESRECIIIRTTMCHQLDQTTNEMQ